MEKTVSERSLFSSPEEELRFLRAEVEKKERELINRGERAPREGSVSRVIESYKKTPPSTVLDPSFKIKHEEAEAIVLNLSPKKTDLQIEELLGILQSRGLLNTLSVLEKLKNPELEDDLHRFLVQYVKKGFPLDGAPEKSILFRALKNTLFEISFRLEDRKDSQRPLKEMISAMEQLYAGLLSAERDKFSFTFEIAVSNENRDVIFYASVPDERKDLFEKQLLSVFPDAKLKEKADDYNIFSERGYVASSFASLKSSPVYPLKTYDQFDYDPLNVILNAFSKIEEVGEGVSIQFIFAPAGMDYVEAYGKALQSIAKGEKLKIATDIRETALGKVGKEIGLSIKDVFFSGEKKEKEAAPGELEKIAMEQIKRKIESPIVRGNIRIFVSAGESRRAETLISDFEAAFNQFENTQGNKLHFERVSPRHLMDKVRTFSFRLFDEGEAMPLSLKELTTLFHFPKSSITATPELKQSKAATAPAPISMSSSGMILGVNRFRGSEKTIYFAPEDRLRHFYTIGQTGTGKSTLLKQMIIQDIKNGDGVCMIDPHGSDILEVLGNIPENRKEDVIYFDPGYTPRPMGLNMLEYDERYPEQKTFVVNELISIFNKLFDMKVAGGPAFEQYFRNSALLVMEHPESGNTLIEIGRVLGDKAFRDLKLSYSRNPIVTQFWANAERTTGEQALSNFVPYITSKFDAFLSNDIMRPVVAQERSTFNFRKIMDEKKILLVNLSKGRLGDINANLIGLVLVGKILMAALSRVDSLDKNLPPFYLYIDEFQNITTDSIATILSEARKYKLSLSIAHQFIAQLEDKIKDAVFGNVGSLAIFRLGAEDAEVMAKQLSPVFEEKDIMNLDNLNAYMRLLVSGKPADPFNIEIQFPPRGNHSLAEEIKNLSYQKYGRPREEVEAEIMNRYKAKEKLASESPFR